MLFTFLVGVFALLGWLYATSADRLALRMMWVGLIYVLVAAILNAFPLIIGSLTSLGGTNWWFSLETVLILPLIEEMIKSRAAQSQRVPIHSFALVCLFGIYELMLSKPLAMTELIGHSAILETVEALPALTMHTLTAAIYAFALSDRRWVQIAICVVIHAVWNGLLIVGWFDLLPVFAGMAVLATILLFPWKDHQRRGQWGST